MEPVLRLVEDHAFGAVQHLGGDLLTPVGQLSTVYVWR
jgi:hypothetical protein